MPLITGVFDEEARSLPQWRQLRVAPHNSWPTMTVAKLDSACRQKSLGATLVANYAVIGNTESRKIPMLISYISVHFRHVLHALIKYRNSNHRIDNNWIILWQFHQWNETKMNLNKFQGFWYLKQEELKYGTNSVPWQLFLGRGTKISKYGTPRKIREAWKAYQTLLQFYIDLNHSRQL